jgi:Leucine-rich repeat (LRR) protein
MPNLGLMLVSISKIAAMGCNAVFKDSSLKILDHSNNLLTEIPVLKGLYHVDHEEVTMLEIKTVTVDVLHHKMGHITSEDAWALVTKGIGRLSLDNSWTDSPCNLCEFTMMI